MTLLCLLPTLVLAAPRFSVAGQTSNNEVRLRTSTAHVETVLRVDLLPSEPGGELEGDAPDAGTADTRVTVLVDPLLAADGTQVPVTVRVGNTTDGAADAPISVRQPVTVTLSADLPAPGEYKGRVVLLGDGAREVTPLFVQRVEAAPTVQFYPVAPARGWTLGPFSGKATVRLSFRETAGVGGAVGPAAVVQLDRKEGGAGNGAAPVQAQDARWVFRGADGAQEGPGAGGVLQVPAHGTGLLNLDVSGLPESGEYTGTVRLLVTQGTPVEQTFTVWVKTPATWGAFLIFLGVVTSAAVRFYVQRVRPRVTLRGRAEAARQKLQELVPARPLEREATVAASLRRQVDALLANIQRPLSGLVVQDSVLALFEARLQLFSLWSGLLRQLEGLKGVALLDAERKLKAVEALLQNEQATSADFTEQAQFLRTLDLESVARAVLESRLSELEQQSQTLMTQRGDDPVTHRLQGELPLYLLRARQQLPGPDLDASRRLVEAAREAFLEILLSDLEGSINVRELPGGFTPDEWAELRAQVGEKLVRARAHKSASVDEAFLYYQSAHALYLRALVDNLDEAVAAAQVAAGGGGDLSTRSDWETEVDAHLDAARAHLDKIGRAHV